MRLRQLAIKLGIDQHKIIDFLTQQGFEVRNHGNSKIPDEYLPLLYSKFTSPVSKSDNTPTEPESTKQEPVNQVEEVAPVEVIRAKKIKLEGIKVIGKIDLPEPRDKEKKSNRVNKERTTSLKRNNKPRKKQASYAQRIASEEKQRQKELREKKKKIKAQKKLHYEQKMASVGKKPVKKSVKVKNPKKPNPQPTPQKKQIHKNPLIRFWHWLNGRYD